MTKAEYMKQLQEKLENFGRELQEDIMEDYRQHFTEGELQGKTDEEIIQELGNIEDMVRDLPESDRKENRLYPDLTEAAQETSQFKEETAEKKAPESTARESSHGNPPESDSESEWEKTLVYSGNYEAVELSGEAADIILKASEDDRIHVEYANRSRNTSRQYVYYQYEENGIFYAGVRNQKANGRAENPKKKESSWKMTLFGQTIISYTKMENIKNDLNLTLTVRIPNRKIPRLHAKVSSGDIHICGLVQEELFAESLSGDIQASSLTSGDLQLQSGSGDISLAEIACGKKLTVKALSGDLDMKNLNVQQYADIKITSGDADIVSLTGHDLRIESFSGDISMNGITANVLNLRTASGDMSIDSVTSDSLNAEAFSGDISLSDAAFKTGTFSVRSGDLSLTGLRFETGSFTSNQGDICFTNAEFESGSFTTENGDISGTDTNASSVSFVSREGDITLRDSGDSHCGKYRCSTESGDISIQSGAEIYECTVRSGDISVVADGAPKRLSLCSSCGDLTAEALGTPESIELQSNNGDIYLKLSETQGMEVNMDSGQEDSEVRWNGERRMLKNGTCVYGNGAAKVTVRAGRGDVCVSGSSR